MSIRLIALDLDGTLLHPDHFTISARSLRALQAAAERGIQIVPASGRVLDLMRDIICALGNVRYAISSNGAAVEDLRTGQRLWDRSIPVETTAELLRRLDPYDIPLEVYYKNHVYVSKRAWASGAFQSLPDAFLQTHARVHRAVDSLQSALSGGAAEKINMDGIPAELSQQLWSGVSTLEDLMTTSSCAGNFEINHRNANKGDALAHLCGLLGVSAEETMAFGDGDNDVQMLQWAGWAFAMENGSPKAKAAAGRQTASNGMDGVARAVEQFV